MLLRFANPITGYAPLSGDIPYGWYLRTSAEYGTVCVTNTGVDVFNETQIHLSNYFFCKTLPLASSYRHPHPRNISGVCESVLK